MIRKPGLLKDIMWWGLSLIFYLILFFALYPLIGNSVAMVELIPILLIAWFYGLVPGFFFALFTAFLNTFVLFPMVGETPLGFLRPQGIIGEIGILVVTLLVGYFSEVRKQLKQELLERERAEMALQKLRQELEERVEQRAQALEISRQSYKLIMEQASDGILITKRSGRVVQVNQRLSEMLGYSEETLLQMNWFDLVGDFPNETFSTASLTTGKMIIGEQTLQTAKGKGLTTEISARMLPDGRFQGIIRDISHRKKTEEVVYNIARGVSATTGVEFFRSLVVYLSKVLSADIVLVGELIGEKQVIQTTAVYEDGQIVDNFEYDLTGTPCANVVRVGPAVYTSDVAKLFPLDTLLFEKEIEAYVGYPLLNSSGQSLGLLLVLYKLPLQNTELIQATLRIFAARAVAELERQRAQHALRESEAKLQQAQKMEAIGRLAGGVAHDFNNILTIIISRSDMVMRLLNTEDRSLRKSVTRIKEAGERAAKLTKQLLAFSRRQVMEPTIIDLNTLISNLMDMLTHLIHENVHLETNLAPNLSLVNADATQLEQVVMNLALNAHDAMAHGGILNIETADVVIDLSSPTELNPGKYVLITISDTGMGMDKETQAQIFEPFFTTKGRGKGTGLGLATVHGIVKQSQGHIEVVSEPDVGTTFRVYLPAVIESEHESRKNKTAPDDLKGSETILLVEDDQEVSDLAQQILEHHGYLVLPASGESAVSLCRSYEGPIHLLLTDVIMPGVSGPDLARYILEERPEIGVLYMSGYTDNILSLHGIDEGITLLSKPFTPQTLAKKVRATLNEIQENKVMGDG
ncbi:MAG: ATP-binding protein [Ardenticatenaceae bacterium]|nr:ATP-binding protein [Ardenticatenaceae bacterium]